MSEPVRSSDPLEAEPALAPDAAGDGEPERAFDDSTADFALLHAWQEGDRAAGELLLSRYFDLVCRFMRNRAAPRDVDDLVQATFLDCVQNRTKIRETSSFRAFILAVARYRFFDHLRARRPERDAATMSKMSIADLGTSPSRRYAREQEAALLWAAMDSIPAQHQIALELAYWEGMSSPEIATVLDVPQATVRSRLMRARTALRDVLARQLGEGPAGVMLQRVAAKRS